MEPWASQHGWVETLSQARLTFPRGARAWPAPPAWVALGPRASSQLPGAARLLGKQLLHMLRPHSGGAPGQAALTRTHPPAAGALQLQHPLPHALPALSNGPTPSHGWEGQLPSGLPMPRLSPSLSGFQERLT